MDRTFTDYFMDIVSSHSPIKHGEWTNINCPMCGDKRKRLGVLQTDTGGLRLSCFNGGCDLQYKPAGWEPGSPVYKKMRTVYERLGGSWSTIPMSIRMPKGKGRSTALLRPSAKWSFPKISLPDNSMILNKAVDMDDSAMKVAEYAYHRSPAFFEMDIPLFWSREYPTYLILPYLDNNNEVIGYLGRNIDLSNGKPRFIQRKGPNYLYGQHQIKKDGGYLFITESPFDAALCKGVATMSARMSKVVIETIKSMNKIPIVIPDKTEDKEYLSFITTAQENGWLVSVPPWKHKDFGESVRDIGLLNSIETVIEHATDNYLSLKLKMKMKHAST